MDCRTQLASMASEEVSKGDFELATKLLSTSIRIEPNNYELYLERSICYHKLANYRASLDDANAAIRLNSTDYTIHYQKGLALIGLSQFSEAVASFKKAIELRAKQDDTKLSDIFKLLRDATQELKSARNMPGATTVNRTDNTAANNSAPSAQAPVVTTTPIASFQDRSPTNGRNSDPVDSTTDKPISEAAIASRLGQTTAREPVVDQPTNRVGLIPAATVKNGTSNLVAESNRNNNQKQCANQMMTSESIASPVAVAAATTTTPIRVSSSATQQHQFSDPGHHRSVPSSFGVSSAALPHQQSHDHHQMSILMPTTIASDNSKAPDHHQQLPTIHVQHHGSPTTTKPPQQPHPPPATGSFEWNIRRSERIFLHNSSEPGTSGPIDETGSQPRARLNSNPSSVSSGKGANKRPYERHNDIKPPAYQSAVRNGTNSVLDSEVDVDDSSTYSNHDSSGPTQKRVMVTPSSSMPATSQQGSSNANSKEDSYSSKYKRLRRDRERARRGTSKLCTIKPSDLEELHRMSQLGSERRFMRVIAPIDGWLYSGQLSVDDSSHGGGDDSTQYVVKLDGDSSGSSYLFSQETVLNDVIKEVRVKSVSELRKGARICCYWSRTYKCLSTGVVTSRTFEATKSLVSVKYDNGDLSALPLEDLRLLPPDYPKYMSNCDPLLLAKNGASSDTSASPSKTSRIVVDCKSSNYRPCATYSKTINNSAGPVKCEDQASDVSPQHRASRSQQIADQATSITQQEDACDMNQNGLPTVDSMRSAMDDDTIPPTDETINFITNEENLDGQDDETPMDGLEHQEGVPIRDNMTATSETTPPDASRASSEENNYGIEYRPWVFEGPPKRSKRNGRTYRDTYSSIRRGSEVIKVGDSAELMPRDESILPFIAKIDGLWATSRGEMRVRVRWYYRLVETEGEPYELEDGENALFETDHFDENDVQSIWRTTKILSWTDYARDHITHVNKPSDGPKIFYLAGYYDPVRRIKHLRSDVKSIQ